MHITKIILITFSMLIDLSKKKLQRRKRYAYINKQKMFLHSFDFNGCRKMISVCPIKFKIQNMNRE